jgi:hypothetical protein
VDQPTASVHWLTCTVHTGQLDGATDQDVRDLVRGAFSAPLAAWVDTGMGGRRFDRLARLQGHGVAFYSQPSGVPAGCGYVSIDLSGEACEELSVPGCFWLLREMDARGWWWSASRIDLAVDGVPFTPLDMAEAYEAGNLRTWCKVDNPDSVVLQWSGRGEKRTHTFYLGHAQSERRLRVYDKRGFTRVELQLRGDHAKVVAKVVSAVPVSFGDCVVGCVRSYVDVIDRASSTNISRCKLLSWWAAWVDGVVAFRCELVKPEPTLERATRWVEASLAPMLAAIMRARGEAAAPWLERLLLRDGPARWGPKHRALFSAL